MNLNSRSSLDPRWTTHHVPVVKGFMKAIVKIVRKTPGAAVTYDRTTKTYTTAHTIVYTGPARVQPFGIMGDMVVGQDTTSRRLMRVQIEEKDVGANVDDMVYVLDCPDNRELETYNMEVRGALGSSNAWVTDLVCEADAKHGS